MSEFSFELLSTDGLARRGRINTPHGVIETPVFMPVGTRGSVKSLGPDDLTAAGTQILLGNTYHLMLRPGAELVKRMGGLHTFMSWKGPILTDSGGFQVFSLAQGKQTLVEIDEDGVTFRSYIDGSIHRVTPEVSMAIQMDLGADFIMAFDQCPPGKSSRDDVRAAMDKTSAWLKRCTATMDRPNSRLLGIIQGAIYDDLRAEHAQEICQSNLFGYAIGGLSVGEAKEDMWRACAATTAHMPQNKPRYLMGVGTPEDLLDGIALGVDMFDCVMPTRNARNGSLFTSRGKVSIKTAQYREDQTQLDEDCSCYTCRTFSKAYLRHLFVCEELLFYRLASIHNTQYYLTLMTQAREAIAQGKFDAFRKNRVSHCELSR